MQEIPPGLWESFTHLISPSVCFNWISHMSLWLPGLCSASRNGIQIANMSQLKKEALKLTPFPCLLLYNRTEEHKAFPFGANEFQDGEFLKAQKGVRYLFPTNIPFASSCKSLSCGPGSGCCQNPSVGPARPLCHQRQDRGSRRCFPRPSELEHPPLPFKQRLQTTQFHSHLCL